MKKHKGFSLIISSILLLNPAAGMSTNNIDDQRPECQMWAHVENKTLPLQNKGHVNCTTNSDCTGFSCKGIYQEMPLSFGIRVLACRDPPGVEMFGSAPQFHAKNFSHVFTHQSQYDVPGALLNFSTLGQGDLEDSTADTLNQLVQGKLEVNIQRNPDGKSLTLGLIARGCIEQTCIFGKPIFNHSKIPVPDCKNEKNGGKIHSRCNLNELYACGLNQICVQASSQSPSGQCECLRGFVPQDDGTCLSRSEDEARSEAKRKSVRTPKKLETNKSSSSSSSAAAIHTVVALVIIGLVVGLGALIVLRTRAVPRLRAMLSNKPYEDIVIGSQRSESTQNVIS